MIYGILIERPLASASASVALRRRRRAVAVAGSRIGDNRDPAPLFIAPRKGPRCTRVKKHHYPEKKFKTHVSILLGMRDILVRVKLKKKK